MNIQQERISLKVEGYQVTEAVMSIFHTVMFHRSLGKISYETDSSYQIKGSVGFMEVDCDFIDLTYVACSSESLNEKIKHSVIRFSDDLRNTDGKEGDISLEFFEKRRKSSWQLHTGILPWEMWTVNVELTKCSNTTEQIKRREDLSLQMTEKITTVTDILNSERYVPSIPEKDFESCIFDTSFPDVEPYNFRILHNTQSNIQNPNVSEKLWQIFYKNVIHL